MSSLATPNDLILLMMAFILLVFSVWASLTFGFSVWTPTLTVATSGQVTFAGTLADGTTVSQSAKLSQYGQWPLYASLNSGKGQLRGWLGRCLGTDPTDLEFAYGRSGKPSLAGRFAGADLHFNLSHSEDLGYDLAGPRDNLDFRLRPERNHFPTLNRPGRVCGRPS